ncbi:MAG: hypothetical protein J5879_03570 [Clostridia bacterium]|nr:hypothetical protein [Clostridia bacterium]
MKRIICGLLSALFLLCACTAPEHETTAYITETDTATNSGAESTADAETAEPDDDVVYISADSYYNNGYTSNYIVALDKLGRSFDATLPRTDKEKQVGLFYFLLLGQHPEYPQSNKIFDVSKILQMENGMALMFDKKSQNSSIAPAGALYFWGEPLYGYYNMKDVWVIRRHLQLLTAAGVDFLCFDVTNAYTYDAVHTQIMKEICSLKEQGWEDVPEVVFYTHTKSTDTVKKLYSSLYSKELYKDAWYMYNGKPLIVAYTDVEADKKATNNASYKPTALSDEILEFFSFKDPVWPDEKKVNDNGMPWIDWKIPARVYGDVINVAVAAHPYPPMSSSLTKKVKNYGRGYSVATKKNVTEDAEKGTYFQSCWDNALAADTDIVFVTGWNEWIAAKYEINGEYALVDLCNDEFSRDAEMMKGGYEDNFYLQLCENIRRFKCTSTGDVRADSPKVSVPMTEDVSVWDGVKAVFRNVGVDNTARDHVGAGSSVRYKQAAARNNICEVRVTEDEQNLYFFIRSDSDIADREDGDDGWMNIFIGVAEIADKGWCGYEYVVNRSSSNGVASVGKLNADFTSSEAGQGSYVLSKNTLQVRVPKSALGISGSANVYFKVADGIEHPEDITDYYVSGRSLPMGRLSYRYLG